jgi:hypothetical protein
MKKVKITLIKAEHARKYICPYMSYRAQGVGSQECWGVRCMAWEPAPGTENLGGCGYRAGSGEN